MKSSASRIRMPRQWPYAAGLALSVTAAILVTAQREPPRPGPQPDGSILTTTNQTVSPIGRVRLTSGVRPKDLAVSPDGRWIAVLTTNGVLMFEGASEQPQRVAAKTGPVGITWAPDGASVYAAGAGGVIHVIARGADRWQATELKAETAEETRGRPKGQPADPQVTGLAVSPDGTRLYAALGIRNQVAVYSLPDGKRIRTVPVGIAPYSLTLTPDGASLITANRGGRLPTEKGGGPRADSAGSMVRVNGETDAARRGSLCFTDTATWETVETDAGRQPVGLSTDRRGKVLFVANSDEDTVSTVDIATRRITATVAVRPEEDPGFGQIPTDTALSSDETRLFVPCGGANTVAVFAYPGLKLLGHAPAGWYPIAVATHAEDLIIASAKGVGPRPADAGGKYRVHGSVGTVQFVTSAQVDQAVLQVSRIAANNTWGRPAASRSGRGPVPVPERLGEPSLFKHVVYIIRENHTYDMDFGDIPEGDGDPALCVFGEQITPNSHALAREFILLDNTHTSGTNSADGHQWTSSAVANGYIEQNYGAHARSYPYDGGDPLAYSPQGFLWTAAAKKGHTVRVFGEFVNRPIIQATAAGRRPSWKELWDDYKSGRNHYSIKAETDNAALKPLLNPNCIGFPLVVSDQYRADQFLKEFGDWQKAGSMPALSILLLPANHTSGTQPGMPTPRAAVADNDLALGRIVDAITHSSFWEETLIVVIEDDSQLGIDHVDGHRTVALCISPYTRRGAVSSEYYTHLSFLRTIGLVLGIPPMTRFDRAARPLTACFTDRPDFRPYTVRRGVVPLDELNPPARALAGEQRRLAEACDRLDWSDLDRADAQVVTRAVWRSLRPRQPFPERHFHPVARVDTDD